MNLTIKDLEDYKTVIQNEIISLQGRITAIDDLINCEKSLQEKKDKDAKEPATKKD